MACTFKTLFLAAAATLFLLFTTLLATSGTAGAQSAQPSTAAPPPEKVQELIKLLDDPSVRAWLATKSPSSSESAAEAEVATQISGWESLVRNRLIAMRKAFPRIPVDAANAVAVVKADINSRGFVTIFALFAALLAIGFGAEWLFKRALVGLRRSGARHAAIPGGAANHHGLIVHLISETAPFVVFFLVSAGIFLAFEWPALLREVILRYLVAFIAVRAVMAVARLLLSPSGVATPEGEKAPLRLIPASDIEADFWYRRVVVFAGYFMAGWATVSLLPVLGFPTDDAHLIAYLLGLGLLLLAIEALWRRPHRVAVAERLNIKDWLLTAYLVLLWGLWVVGFTGLLWLGIYALLLPKVLRGASGAAEALARRMENPNSPSTIRTVIIVRSVRALVIALAVAWLALVLRMSPAVLAADETVVNRISRGVLHGVIILLIADLIWHLAKVSIDRKLAMSAHDDTVSPTEAARRGRLRTLLPIFRNILAVFLATVAVLMVLSGLGVEIGPLIAGAGIFGVAIGFGSQTLVKDVISGVFYMLDDAFRVGEYIQSGSYKGTVESFSLRSVQAPSPPRPGVHRSLRFAGCSPEHEPRLGDRQVHDPRPFRNGRQEGQEAAEGGRRGIAAGSGTRAAYHRDCEDEGRRAVRRLRHGTEFRLHDEARTAVHRQAAGLHHDPGCVRCERDRICPPDGSRGRRREGGGCIRGLRNRLCPPEGGAKRLGGGLTPIFRSASERLFRGSDCVFGRRFAASSPSATGRPEVVGMRSFVHCRHARTDACAHTTARRSRLPVDGKIGLKMSPMLASAARTPHCLSAATLRPISAKAALAADDLRFWFRLVHDKIASGHGGCWAAGCQG